LPKFYNATYIHLGVYMNGVLIGILQYGYAMNPASCGSVVKDTAMDEYLELRCGGFGIVYQSANFEYYGEHTSDFYELDGEVFHKIQFTVTPKDKRYKAVKHLIDRKNEAIIHKLRQFRYIYFINQKSKKNVLLKKMPYPKHYNNILAES